MTETRQSISLNGGLRARAGLFAAVIAAVAAMLPGEHVLANEPPAGTASGLPVPRFVSLRSDRVNARVGPNRDQDVRWIYTRAGMPVEIIAEFENWRRIRDWEGAEGWVYHSLLSGRRTAVIVPKEKEELVPLHDSASIESPVVAKLQAGVMSQLKSCSGTWCRIFGRNFDGWIQQERLWGAYPNEKVE